MWTLFKIINFLWLLTATAIWPLSLYNHGPLLVVVNTALIFLMTMLPIKANLNLRIGMIVGVALCMIMWSTYIDGLVFGALTALQLLLAIIIVQLPYEYLKDLLQFATKWLAILLIPGLLIYWALFFVDLPSFGQFVHPNYVPFNNYIFYIQTTWDNGVFTRFNAFLLEPGHLALLCTFLTMANQYRFKECKWLYVLAISIVFSFSLAGYLLFSIGWCLMKIDSIAKAIIASIAAIGLLGVAYAFIGTETAINKLILERLERDDHAGIKGNNRFTDTTEFVYQQAVKNGTAWVGIKNKTNMKVIEGAGYKIFVIQKGFIGVILALLFYIVVIPSNPDYRYTIAYLAVLAMCFIQRSAPEMYHWLFPYITGIYLAKYEKKRQGLPES